MRLKIVEVQGMSIISIKDSCAFGEVPTRITEIYTELGIFMEINNIERAGNSLALYYAYSPEKVVFEPAFLVIGEVEETDRVKVKEGPFGRAIKAIHVGDYEGLSEVRLGIKEYAKKMNVELTNSYWEVYFNQSGEIEGAQSETHIYYSVK
ncbi:MAG: effector-binding domain-containing protein [Vicingaceae bacterium]|jgi:effector-binding domain-containing protein